MKTYPFINPCYLESSRWDESFADRLDRLRQTLDRAERVVIGAGAGLSAAAGIEYGGKRFTTHFPDFIARYGLTDMYSATFYPYPTEEERWAYWARHIRLNRFCAPTELYRKLYETLRGKDYFVITTNVDAQFERSGFAPERIFAVQGDYGYLQCALGCHDTLYYNEKLIRNLCNQTENCRILTELVPRCPVCGGRMEVHVRKDRHFVQDDQWHAQYTRYQDFMEKALHADTLLLELGVGYNTPTIIRFPFEQITARHRNVTLARLNRDYPEAESPMAHFIPFDECISVVINKLR